MSFATKPDAIDALPKTPASDVKKLGWRGVMRDVQKSGRVVVTNHDAPEAVILSAREYEAIIQALDKARGRDQATLEALRARFDERLKALKAPGAGVKLLAAARKPVKLRGKVKARGGALSERPVLYVLAGVNGAGKSSIGGQHLLDVSGMPWFNPDTFAREYREATGCGQEEANVIAWSEGMRYLDEAIANGTSYAFETTLGGRTVPAKIAAAAATHDVVIWYCGLASPELHVARVKARVAAGGHDIPEGKIRERYESSLVNLIALLPRLSSLAVYDNSTEAEPGQSIADPVLVLVLDEGRILFPDTAAAIEATPDWAKPLVEAALSERG